MSSVNTMELNFKETELTLGLPGKSRVIGDKCGTKRSFCDLKLGLILSNIEHDNDDEVCNYDISENHSHVETKPRSAKAQVVGWPPVRAYRKNAMKSCCKYVKVAVDGAPYLRKVDLEMYNSYPQLLSALQNMFYCFTTGDYLNKRKLMEPVNGSEYVPTYEDKDGDWMLVGDVPWIMFVESCKRLRLMRSSEVHDAATLSKDSSITSC